MFFLSLLLLSIYLFLISPTDVQPSCESVCSSPNSWNVLLERADCFGDGHGEEFAALACACGSFVVIYRFHLRPATPPLPPPVFFLSSTRLIACLKITSLERVAHASVWASNAYGRVGFSTARLIARCLAQSSVPQPGSRIKGSTRSSGAPLPGQLEKLFSFSFSSFHHNIFTSVRACVCAWDSRGQWTYRSVAGGLTKIFDPVSCISTCCFFGSLITSLVSMLLTSATSLTINLCNYDSPDCRPGCCGRSRCQHAAPRPRRRTVASLMWPPVSWSFRFL